MTPQLLLDLALLLVILVYALRGLHNGLVAGTLGLVGMLLGLYAALWVVPLVIARFEGLPQAGTARSVILILGVVISASLGRTLLGGLGRRMAWGRREGRVRRFDGLLGFVAAGLVTTLLTGVLGAAVKPVAPTPWAMAMNQSRVLATIERVLPGQSQRWAAGLTVALDSFGLPGAFSGLVPEPIIPAEAPNASDANGVEVQAAAASVVKVVANACSQQLSGSGWVVAPQRIVTNAHVIAGSSEVSVQVGGTGPALNARVVAFDPDLDLAILDVPELTAPALQRAEDLPKDAPAVVAGFPLGGSYRADAARNRGEIQALGEDIYGSKEINREVYSLYATAKPGNSGGPLLTIDGRVAGTVFTRSIVDANTAYALTDAATDTLLDGAASYAATIGTGACTR